MVYKHQFAAILLIIFVSASADGITGCGGSIKASRDVQKNFASAPLFNDVSVSLITRDGIVQERTECSPQGYFFIPIYDMGDYTVVVEGKDGWSVNPQSISVSLSDTGVVTGCEDKISFEITGFKVSGHVHNAKDMSSSHGVSVHLLSSAGSVLKTVESDNEGNYVFENVISGDYSIAADHPSWVIREPTKQQIKIGFGSVVVANDFVVSGYKVTGRVENQTGENDITSVFLLLRSLHKERLECESEGVEGCLIPLEASGHFDFRIVGDGNYILTPYLKKSPIEWTIKPSEFTFTVSENSVDIGIPFVISGYALHGRVVDETGRAMEGVCIGVDSHVTESCTDKNGYYTLPDMVNRLYMIDGNKEHYHFSFIKIEAKPNLVIKDLTILHYNMCGMIELSTLRNYPNLPKKYTVQVLQDEKVIKSMETPENFCFMMEPGEYDVRVEASQKEGVPALSFTTKKGLVLRNQAIEDNVTLRVIAQTIEGIIEMLTDNSVKVMLYYEDRLISEVMTDANHHFVFEGVLASVYTLRVEDRNGCWSAFEDGSSYSAVSAEYSVDVCDHVREKSIHDIVITQYGYVLTITSTMEAKGLLSSIPIALTYGPNYFCLSKKTYKLVIEDCFTTNPREYSISVLNRAITIVPTEYTVEGIVAIEKASLGLDVFIEVRKGEDTIKRIAATRNSDEHYSYSLSLPEGTYTLSYSAPNSYYLFYPRSVVVSVLANHCQSAIQPIQTQLGRILSGQVIPALKGVLIRMKITENGEVREEETYTDEKGVYHFGPYTMEAIKEGHIFHVSKNGLNFSHQKLSSLRIRVFDTKKESISGVLISLSGEDYNSNELSRVDGTFVFGQLFPGSYYLHCQLKEYQFTPSTQTIIVEEGQAIDVDVFATRVAYSVLGRVSTITNQPQSKVKVLAISEDGTHKESAMSDIQGNYRIRGLHAGSLYRVTTVGIESVVPVEKKIVMKEEDVLNENFMVFAIPATSMLYGVVHSEDGFVEELQVTAVNQQGQKKTKTTQAGTFTFSSLSNGEYTLKVASPSKHNQIQCEEVRVSVERNRLNNAEISCSVKRVNEIDTVKGGSFFLLGIVSVLVFAYVEKEQIRMIFN